MAGHPIDFQWYPSPLLVADRMDVAATRMADMSVPLRQSAFYVRRNVAERFASEGSDVGGWAPWAVRGNQGPSRPYVRTYKQKGGRGRRSFGRILMATGNMFDHTQEPSSYGVVGNTLIYYPLAIRDKVHSAGSMVRNIYPREFMGLNAAGESIVIEKVWLPWMQSVIAGTAAGRPGESFMRGGKQVFQPRSSLGTFLPGATVIG